MRNARLVDAITHQALHDALTGLPNRSLVNDRVERLLTALGATVHPLPLCSSISTDSRTVNDGSPRNWRQLLQAVAARLTTAARDTEPSAVSARRIRSGHDAERTRSAQRSSQNASSRYFASPTRFDMNQA